MEINIKTKFDLGQKVVVFNSSKNKLQDIEIVEVQFDTDGCDSRIWYRDGKTKVLFRERDVYASRADFIAQL